MKQLTSKQAIEIHNLGEWKNWTHEEIVKFQLFQECLAVPFSVFHEAIEAVLGRPVWTHEFASVDNLISEYEKERPAPSFEDIVGLLPKDSTILVAE